MGRPVVGMATYRVLVGYSKYMRDSIKVAGRISYPYMYPRVNMCTRTSIRQVSGGYRIPVGPTITHVKPHQNSHLNNCNTIYSKVQQLVVNIGK
jgi:hypothetical protein